MATYKLRFVLSAILTFTSLGSRAIPADRGATSIGETSRRVLLIGLDGTKGPQVQKQVFDKKAPTLAHLMHDGQYAPCSKVSDPACARAQSGRRTGDGYRWLTGPGWASVITGVDNRKHLIKNNSHDELKNFAQTSKSYPSFFKRAKDLGWAVAAGGVASYMTSVTDGHVVPGVIDYECGASSTGPRVSVDASKSCNLDVRHAGLGDDSDRDRKLARWMKTQVSDPKMKIIMGVFDQIDAQGHKSGFGDNEHYLNAISDADRLLKDVVALVQERVQSNHEAWLIIVTADHGGHKTLFGGSHGTVEDDDEVIPFIVTTYGDNTKLRPLTQPVSHLDAHPTIMKWLGQKSPQVDGHVQGIH